MLANTLAVLGTFLFVEWLRSQANEYGGTFFTSQPSKATLVIFDTRNSHIELCYLRFPYLDEPIIVKNYGTSTGLTLPSFQDKYGDLLLGSLSQYERTCAPGKPIFLRDRTKRITELNLFGILGFLKYEAATLPPDTDDPDKFYQLGYRDKCLVVGKTSTWAALLLVPRIGLLAVSRFRRKKMDPTRCISCRYDLRGSLDSEKCPECGTAISAGQKETIRGML